MKKIIILLLAILAYLVAPFVNAEEILDFTQKVIIKDDASLEISETITYDFGALERYGIFRDIPYKYKARGSNYNLRLEDINVVNKKGEAYDFEILQEGASKRIKISEADVLVSGKQIYVISYTLKRAVNFLDDYDEIYWNVTGGKWPVKIRQSKSTIVLPIKISEDDLQAECFTGVLGSTDNCVSKRYVYEGAGMVKEIVYIDDVLSAGKSFAIVAGLPRGIISEPSFFSKLIDFAKANYAIGLLLLVLLFFYNLWKRRRLLIRN